MSDVNAERLRIVRETMARLQDDMPVAILCALDAHDAAQARGRVTDEALRVAVTTYSSEARVSVGSRAMRAALLAVAPLLATRAEMPAEVTSDMCAAAQLYLGGLLPVRHMPLSYEIQELLQTALAAAPRQPARDAEPVGGGMTDKCAGWLDAPMGAAWYIDLRDKSTTHPHAAAERRIAEVARKMRDALHPSSPWHDLAAALAERFGA